MAHLHRNSQLERLREAINQAYRRDETECLQKLLKEAEVPEKTQQNIAHIAKQLVITTRKEQKKLGLVDQLLHHYDISSDEGVALMTMAEALLRIPDHSTIDKLIADKISSVDWSKYQDGCITHAATWSLLLTGKIFSPTIENQKNLLHSLKQAISRIGIEMIRPIILQGMKIVGKHFVMGETIDLAVSRARQEEQQGYRFSYDMLGESARTSQDAEHYFHSYLQAIVAIGNAARYDNPIQNPGISIKLSALHPRYDYNQRERVLTELVQRVLLLAQQARHYQIGLTIDAEECDRLDLSLDIFQRVFEDPAMNHWEGLGLAVQAYQKRAFYVLDWLIALSKINNKPIMVRLVKGAYWDYEIKQTLKNIER